MGVLHYRSTVAINPINIVDFYRLKKRLIVIRPLATKTRKPLEIPFCSKIRWATSILNSLHMHDEECCHIQHDVPLNRKSSMESYKVVCVSL